MKFSNGCWLQKERCECFSPAEVYFSKIEKDQVTICAPTSKITREFDTLKSKKVPQSLEIGLFFCQIFIFII